MPGLQAPLGLKDPLDPLGRLAPKVQPAQRALKARRVLLVRRDRLGPPVRQEQLEPLGRPAQRVQPDRLVLRGQRARLELLGLLERQEPLERRVRLDLPDLPDRLGLKAPLVPKDPPERELFLPTWPRFPQI